MRKENPYEWFGGQALPPGETDQRKAVSAGKSPNLYLLGLGLAYPVASFTAMYVAAGFESMFHIPSYRHYVVFVYVLPSLTVAAILLARFLGVRIGTLCLGGFVVWMVLVASFTKDVIEAIWSAP